MITGQQQMGLPAYFDPPWDVMSPTGIAIMNPNDGPAPAPADSAYQDQIWNVHNNGANGKVIGYVRTTDGTRPLGDVTGDIDLYYSVYPEIDGVFLDEVSTDPQYFSTYQYIYNYVKSVYPNWLVAINPGTSVPTELLSASDLRVSAERPATTQLDQGTGKVHTGYLDDPNWASDPNRAWETPENSATNWHIVHHATCDVLQAVVLASRERNAGIIYATDNTSWTETYNNQSTTYDLSISFMNSLVWPAPTVPGQTAYLLQGAGSGGGVTIPSGYYWNSVSPGAPVDASNYGTGLYWFDLPNLGDATWGNAHVTPIGTGTNRCQINWIEQNGTSQRVYVLCTTRQGTPVNSEFFLSFYRRSGGTQAEGGYSTVSPSTQANQCYQAGDSWNALPGDPIVQRTTTGHYDVYFPSQQALGVQVGSIVTSIPWMGTARYCNAATDDAGWSTHKASVQCYDANGAPADELFQISWSASSPVGSPSYYWLSNTNPGASNTPSIQKGFNSMGGGGGHIISSPAMVNRNQRGIYFVTLPEMAVPGGSTPANIQVTAHGTGDYCTVTTWSSVSGGAQVGIRCFNAIGALADDMFHLVYSTTQ